MSFLSRLFGSRSGAKAPEDVDAAIERLEAEAQKAAPGYVGTAYNRAGDMALKAGQEDRALGFYGRSIDAFLADAQREAARGVANKIIRVRPEAVRTLCTLTWLDLAARHQATALLHLRDYVASARAAGQEVRAATHIYEMARLSPDREFVDAVADALDGLDFSNRAEEVRQWTASGAPGALMDPDGLADACLAAAMRSNERGATLLSDHFEPAKESETSGLGPEPEPSGSVPPTGMADTEGTGEEQVEGPPADPAPMSDEESDGQAKGKGRGRKTRKKRNRKKR